MFRRLTTAMVIGAALLLPGKAYATPGSHAAPNGAGQRVPFGTIATYHVHHTLYPNGFPDDRSGWTYAFPLPVPHSTILQTHSRRAVHRVTRRRPHHAHRTQWHEPIKSRQVQPPQGSFRESMLITYYTDVGPMADGVETYWGAAACGYDLATLTRVYVPGVGFLTCHDRIGFQPYRHIDVWGYRPGLGADWRTVTVY